MQLGGPEKDDAILEMISLGDTLYLVSGRAIHKAVLADTIDPALDHPNTPHLSQKVASSGAESPIVSWTFLQAAKLFVTPHIDEATIKPALAAVLAAMQELLAAEVIFDKLQADLVTAEKDMVGEHFGIMVLPSVGNVETRGKEFVQRAEHCLQAIYRLVVVFYNDDRKPGFFDGFARHVEATYSQQPDFIAFAASLTKFAKLMRALRHCIEHRKPNQKLDFLDYHFEAGQLHRPATRVTHPDVPFSQMPLDDFMNLLIATLLDGVESLIVFIAGVHAVKIAGMDVGVGPHPQFGDPTVSVRFSYLIAIGDPPEWRPLG